MTWVPITKKLLYLCCKYMKKNAKETQTCGLTMSTETVTKEVPLMTSAWPLLVPASFSRLLPSSSCSWTVVDFVSVFVLSPIQWMGWLPPTKTIDPSNQVGILHGKISRTSRSSPITLPETKSSHLQGSYPKRKRIFQTSIFRCELLVSKKVFVWPAQVSPCTSSRGTIYGFLQEFSQAFPGMSSDQMGLDETLLWLFEHHEKSSHIPASWYRQFKAPFGFLLGSALVSEMTGTRVPENSWKP